MSPKEKYFHVIARLRGRTLCAPSTDGENDLLVVVGDVGVLAWRSRALLSDDVGCGTMGEIVVRRQGLAAPSC